MERRTFKRGLMTRAQVKGRLVYSPKPQNDQPWVWWLSPVASFFSGLMWGESAKLLNDQKTTNVNVVNRREIMRRSSLFLTLMMALLLSFGLANAQLGNIYISSVSGDYGGGAEDTLRTGTAIVWTINFANGTGSKVTASNNGFRVFSPDGATWNNIDSTGVAEAAGVWTAAYGANLFFYGPATNPGSGALGDTLGFGGFDTRNPAVGLAPGFNGPALTITLGAPGLSEASSGKRLCITESGYGPNDAWLWATESGSDNPIWGPPGSPYGGPVCYTVFKVPNECPNFTNCPGSLSFNHCASASYDFNAVDPPYTGAPSGDPITYSKVSGPGTVNAGTGMWNYAPTLADVGTAQTLVVGATDGICGGTTQCSVPLTFTNVTPTFTAGCNANTNVGKGTSGSVDMNATAGDCDPFSFSITGVTPTPVGTYSINASTGVITFNTANSDGGTTYDFTVQVTDGKGTSTCHTFFNVLIVEPFELQIEKTHRTVQGAHELVCVTLNKGSEAMWGFDFLIAYDNTALSFVSAIEGDIYTECGWEYFNYRYGANGNCGNACPKGLLRVIGLAETNNGPNHPRCNKLSELPGDLFCLDFLVTNDRTFECQYAPVRFYWNDCGDNSIAYNPSDDPTGFVQAQAISREIHEFDGFTGNIANGNTGFPTYYGAQNTCLAGGGDGKPAPIRFLDLINGGVDIACVDSIDDRGDVNLNGVSNEVADAVLFTNYFVYGMGVFTVNAAGQIAATDVNVDGLVLSVADLVYLIRIVVGDAQPYPKPAPVESVLKISAKGILSIEDVQVGAASIVLAGNVEPTLLANGMKLEYAYDETNNVTRTLIYSMERGRSFTGEFLNVKGSDIVGVEMATFEGAPILAKEVELPTEFALDQNYPNPFNPKTRISFRLPVASDYALTIYNVTGQKVTEFVGSHEAGQVDIDVDAANYSSGVYFYKLIADKGKFTQTKKMVLVK